MKVCVVGTARVGKSSLIRRYVYNSFDEKYLFTIGASVSKTLVEIEMPGSTERTKVTLMLWDIMGEKNFLDLIKEAYFKHAVGIIAVADLTRPETFGDTGTWIGAVREVAGDDIPVVLVGNKFDLVEFRLLDWSPLAEASAKFSAPFLPTSAREGRNVETAFSTIARLALVNELRAGKTATAPA